MKTLLALALLHVMSRATAPAPPALYQEFTGNYVAVGNAEIDKAAVYTANGKLNASASGLTVELSPTKANDLFEVKEYKAQVRFARNPQGQVVRLQVVCADMDMNFQMKKM